MWLAINFFWTVLLQKDPAPPVSTYDYPFTQSMDPASKQNIYYSKNQAQNSSCQSLFLSCEYFLRRSVLTYKGQDRGLLCNLNLLQHVVPSLCHMSYSLTGSSFLLLLSNYFCCCQYDLLHFCPSLGSSSLLIICSSSFLSSLVKRWVFFGAKIICPRLKQEEKCIRLCK